MTPIWNKCMGLQPQCFTTSPKKVALEMSASSFSYWYCLWMSQVGKIRLYSPCREPEESRARLGVHAHYGQQSDVCGPTFHSPCTAPHVPLAPSLSWSASAEFSVSWEWKLLMYFLNCFYNSVLILVFVIIASNNTSSQQRQFVICWKYKTAIDKRADVNKTDLNQLLKFREWMPADSLRQETHQSFHQM